MSSRPELGITTPEEFQKHVKAFLVQSGLIKDPLSVDPRTIYPIRPFIANGYNLLKDRDWLAGGRLATVVYDERMHEQRLRSDQVLVSAESRTVSYIGSSMILIFQVPCFGNSETIMGIDNWGRTNREEIFLLHVFEWADPTTGITKIYAHPYHFTEGEPSGTWAAFCQSCQTAG